MALFEGKTTAERNKTIAALALGAIALFFIVRMLFGSSSSTSDETPPRRTQANANTSGGRTTGGALVSATPDPSLVVIQPVDYSPLTPGVPNVGRNIFAFYVPPPPVLKATPEPTPAPTPPPPPLVLTQLSPSNVFARTGEFAMQVAGDKFTPQTRIYVDGQELQTRFISGQQLAASVPASLIAYPGSRQVMVRTPDSVLYSNSATLNVAEPPKPSYTYVGVLIRPRGNDTAILKDQKGELLSVQRGDLVGGRFRVSSISAREVEFTDQQLKIKHALAYSDPRAGQNNSSRLNQPPPPTKTDDEEEESEP
jgi:hypothetical protein